MEKKKYRVTGERVLHYCGGDVTRIPLETRYTYASSPEKAITGKKGKFVNLCMDRQSAKITKQNLFCWKIKEAKYEN